jgi:hypothetical protein
MTDATVPGVMITADLPLAAEVLEHWAAKLTLRAAPGDAALAQSVQAQAVAFRSWRKGNEK